MSPKAQVRFCPICATRLVLCDDHGIRRRRCPKCGFIYYRNPVPAAGVLLHERGRVLLVRRRYDPRAGAWCLPAGFMEYGETPRRCALRELREETGLEARLGHLFGVYAGFDDPRVRAILVLYVAERTGGTLAPGDDALEARFFPVNRPPSDLAFQAHRQALREFAAQLERRPRDGSATASKRARRPRDGSATPSKRPGGGRDGSATPPRRARAARLRSRRG